MFNLRRLAGVLRKPGLKLLRRYLTSLPGALSGLSVNYLKGYNVAKAYIIKNIKSGYFFTRTHHFEELGYNTKLYKSYRDAYKELEMAKSNQVWDLLEQVYNTDRFHIDCDMGIVDNVAEHVELRIRSVYIKEGENV